jgi:hypothetical protein
MPRPRTRTRLLPQLLVIATGALVVAGEVTSGHAAPGPVMATRAYAREATRSLDVGGAVRARRVTRRALRGDAAEALEVLSAQVRVTSHPEALARRSGATSPTGPGTPSRCASRTSTSWTTGCRAPRRAATSSTWRRARSVEGPFMVATGAGSSRAQEGVPSRFSNAVGSASTSLGLYVAQELYHFRGKTAGQSYESVGLRLRGVSGHFNDRARTRGVVAHGAPYVTASHAGRSEGCPAVEQERAERLLPKLARGGLVFLFAPEAGWMARDPWAAGPSLAGANAEVGAG